jgi:hypothetical protein
VVLARAAPERYPKAAARLGARMIADLGLSVADAQLALAALHTLTDPDPAPGADALCGLLERHHELEAAQHLEQWLERAR